MARFVLVHGAWGGGWEWEMVATGLRARGHQVDAPDLMGLGDTAHLATPQVGLRTHIDGIVDLVTAQDLHDVVLVGQSYGGMVVTGVVDVVPDRIARLIYLDAFVPRDGESCNDLCGPRFAARVRQLAEDEGDGWLVPLPFSGSMGLSEAVASWYIPRLGPQPLATLEEPARLTGAGAHVPRCYVRLLESPGEEPAGDPIGESARRAREAGWHYLEVVGPHDLHVEDAERLATILADLA